MTDNFIYYINGKWIKNIFANVPFNDSGFLYGDGLFETLRFDNKNIFKPYEHLNRLFDSLKIIQLNLQYDKEYLLQLLKKTIDKNELNSGILRLMITRGTLNNNKKIIKPNIYISIKPFYSIPKEPVKVIYLNENKFPIIRFTPAIKSMNYIGNMLAKQYTFQHDAFEPIFYNKENIITECAIRNIFYIKNDTLYTPSLDLGILSGVMRDSVLKIASQLNINIKETNIFFNQIDSMDEAFVTSTGIGILACYWDGWKSKNNLTKIIKKELFKKINNN